MKKSFLFQFSAGVLVASALVFTSCSTSKYEGYEQTDNGLYYQIHTDNKDAVKPVENDVLEFDIVLKTENDSTFSDTRTSGGPAQIQLKKSTYKGDILEGLAMLGEKDSASFILSADSFFLVTMQYPELPPFIKKGSIVKVEVVLHKIKKFDEVQKEQEAYRKQMEGYIQAEKDTLAKYIAANKISVAPTQSGLYFIEKKKGNGPALVAGDKVKVHYTGKLLNGMVFDSSVKRGVPFEFALMKDAVIRGWHEGISLMKKGGKATLIIPSMLGYGMQGAPQGGIPPFATLVFDVELVDVTSGAAAPIDSLKTVKK